MTSVNSRIGTLIHANSYRLREKALKKFIENTDECQGLPEELAESWSPFKIKQGYRSIKLR